MLASNSSSEESLTLEAVNETSKNLSANNKHYLSRILLSLHGNSNSPPLNFQTLKQNNEAQRERERDSWSIKYGEASSFE